MKRMLIVPVVRFALVVFVKNLRAVAVVVVPPAIAQVGQAAAMVEAVLLLV